MDLGDIFDILDNTPMDKVGDVVEFFVDHSEELDKLISIIKEAPALIANVGDALDEAADHAKEAAVSLVGTVAKAAPAGTAGRGGAAAALIAGAGTLDSGRTWQSKGRSRWPRGESQVARTHSYRGGRRARPHGRRAQEHRRSDGEALRLGRRRPSEGWSEHFAVQRRCSLRLVVLAGVGAGVSCARNPARVAGSFG